MKHLIITQPNMGTNRPFNKVGFVRPITACGDQWDNYIHKRC